MRRAQVFSTRLSVLSKDGVGDGPHLALPGNCFLPTGGYSPNLIKGDLRSRCYTCRDVALSVHHAAQE